MAFLGREIRGHCLNKAVLSELGLGGNLKYRATELLGQSLTSLRQALVEEDFLYLSADLSS